MKVQEGPPPCPECESPDTVTTAIVNVGQWERHFYECPACEASFTGSWRNSHDVSDTVVVRRARRAMVQPASV